MASPGEEDGILPYRIAMYHMWDRLARQAPGGKVTRTANVHIDILFFSGRQNKFIHLKDSARF